MNESDGGAAFPVSVKDGDWTGPNVTGLTIRDCFAAQALMGHLAYSPPDSNRKITEPSDVATLCYEYADAMLAARKVGQQ